MSDDTGSKDTAEENGSKTTESAAEAETVEDDATVIANFEKARSKCKKADRIVSGTILLVLTLNALFAFFSTKSFINNRLPEVWYELVEQGLPVANKHWPRVMQAADTVGPVMVETFSAVGKRELPKVEKLVEKEYAALQKHGETRVADMDKKIDAAILNFQRAFFARLQKEIGRDLTPEEVTRVSAKYRDAFRGRIDQIQEATYHEHREPLNDFRRALRRLILLEPEFQGREVSVDEATGVLMEYVGVELQAKAQINN